MSCKIPVPNPGSLFTKCYKYAFPVICGGKFSFLFFQTWYSLSAPRFILGLPYFTHLRLYAYALYFSTALVIIWSLKPVGSGSVEQRKKSHEVLVGFCSCSSVGFGQMGRWFWGFECDWAFISAGGQPFDGASHSHQRSCSQRSWYFFFHKDLIFPLPPPPKNKKMIFFSY